MKNYNLVAYLLSPAAIRDRCRQILALAQKGKLAYFQYQARRLNPTVDYVITVIKENYPDLHVPYHSRWRHFDAGGIHRMSWIEQDLSEVDPLERGRILFDLVIVSVLLDAGAGMNWRYKENRTQQLFTRSEGLAVAAFSLFLEGRFSLDSHKPLRADGEALIRLSPEQLAEGFQVECNNPLLGLQGRTTLMNQLGKAVLNHPEYFGESTPRLGCLFDYLVQHAEDNQLSAVFIFDTIMKAFGSIWPGRITLENINLGDCWPHPLLQTEQEGSELIPFHKLSQWLSYSLVEPLEAFGLSIEGMDQLTGLAEYRNGGLLLDCKLIELKDPNEAGQTHQPGSTLIVEWRALTVALLDLIAHKVRGNLQMDEKHFPLVKILQGGTWTAGRKIAHELRRDGKPPITLDSDGTVF
ncbi:MAG: URC4/urg3 family protein [Candidatus Binatia bacterium]